MTHSTIAVNVHDTPEAIYESFSRVFTEQTHDRSRWVTFNSGDVQITLFASQQAPELAEVSE